MHDRWSNSKVAWMLGGMFLGMAIAYIWPAEPVLAQAAEANDKFAMCTLPTLAGSGDAVFILDMLTGRLLGASYSPQARGFNQTYARLIAADFGVADKADYVLVPGRINLTTSSAGGGSPAQGAIYIGEMTSGTICAYGINYIQGPRQIPTQEIVLLAKFPFRQTVN